jgi:hypothetical protein
MYTSSHSQGRVVINEFMPWSPNSCSVNGEFVELMNFGPGPMNIGCYIVTNGKYSVTIPPGTIIQPGQFFVLAGSNFLPQACGNVDSTVQVQLNWNTCNCISTSLPSSGDGFFADGGGANEKVVLFNPSLQVVDAVTRNSPATASNLITTPAVGTCGSQSFDLDNFVIQYEVLGMSTGVGNSFARTIDGDCEWVKDPPQSAHATNNRSGDVSAVTYSLTMTGARDCGNGGSIDIHVTINDATVTDYAKMFPMNYAIAYDANNDGIYDLENDTYTYGSDSTPPSIDIKGLPAGRYRIVVGSVLGCFLATFPVNVLVCQDPLRAQIVNFDLVKKTNQLYTFKWMVTNQELVREILLEKSNNGIRFIEHSKIPVNENSQTYIIPINKEENITYYRLKIIGIDGKSTYSAVINTSGDKALNIPIGPNPVKNELKVQLQLSASSIMTYKIYGTLQQLAAKGHLNTEKGLSTYSIPVQHLPPGVYQLMIHDNTLKQPISFRFVKP